MEPEKAKYLRLFNDMLRHAMSIRGQAVMLNAMIEDNRELFKPPSAADVLLDCLAKSGGAGEILVVGLLEQRKWAQLTVSGLDTGEPEDLS